MAPQEFFACSTPDEEYPGMSRREFVKYLVAAATLDFLGFGGISSDSPDDIPTPGVYQERNPQFSPVTVNLGVVTVAADGLARYDGDDKIRRDIAEQTTRITHTTGGAYRFNVALFNDNAEPDSSRQTEEGTIEAYYSNNQLEEIANKYRPKLGKTAIVMLVVDCAGIENCHIGGEAIYKGEGFDPCIHIPTGNKPASGAYAHEIGHLLSPRGLGEGLGHERVMNCRLEDANGHPTQLYAVDTIQNLISSGCGLIKNYDNTVDQYASPRSVMGNSGAYKEESPEGLPIYSPPNIAFLDPRRRVIRVEPEPGTYPLSYEPGKLFGVEIMLPKDHALKQILPDADTLFFGPIVQSVKDENTPFESTDAQKTIGVFATWNDGRETALLDISLFRDLIPGDRTENVLYADEQLNIVAVSGYGSEGEYMRIIELDTPEGQALLAEAKQRTGERNQLLLDARRPARRIPRKDSRAIDRKH